MMGMTTGLHLANGSAAAGLPNERASRRLHFGRQAEADTFVPGLLKAPRGTLMAGIASLLLGVVPAGAQEKYYDKDYGMDRYTPCSALPDGTIGTPEAPTKSLMCEALRGPSNNLVFTPTGKPVYELISSNAIYAQAENRDGTPTRLTIGFWARMTPEGIQHDVQTYGEENLDRFDPRGNGLALLRMEGGVIEEITRFMDEYIADRPQSWFTPENQEAIAEDIRKGTTDLLAQRGYPTDFVNLLAYGETTVDEVIPAIETEPAKPEACDALASGTLGTPEVPSDAPILCALKYGEDNNMIFTKDGMPVYQRGVDGLGVTSLTSDGREVRMGVSFMPRLGAQGVQDAVEAYREDAQDPRYGLDPMDPMDPRSNFHNLVRRLHGGISDQLGDWMFEYIESHPASWFVPENGKAIAEALQAELDRILVEQGHQAGTLSVNYQQED